MGKIRCEFGSQPSCFFITNSLVVINVRRHYWPDINQTFGTQYFGGSIIVVQHLILTNLLLTQIFFGAKFFFDRKFLRIFFDHRSFLIKHFWLRFFNLIFCISKSFLPNKSNNNNKTHNFNDQHLYMYSNLSLIFLTIFIPLN